MKKMIAFLLVFMAFVELSYAQKGIRVGLMPIIDVSALRSSESPVRISEVKVDVKVVGTMAVTTVDMVFYNPNNRILEGELQFPLGDGQSVSRFALDINGKLREGVVVDKAKGQEAFESVIRQKIDPGLFEKTQGNNFRTRVYPLPAKGTRRIVIAYEQELIENNVSFRFHLPVEYGNVLDRFDLNLTAFATNSQPVIDETPWGKFSFDRAGDAYVASYSSTNYDAKGQLVFSIPSKNSQTQFVEQGKLSGDFYFYTNVKPEIKQKNREKINIPATIALYWDASASMENRDLNKEFQFLDKYFEGVSDKIVFLYSFNLNVIKSQTYIIKEGNWSELRKVLENIKYDGATQYGTLNLKNSHRSMPRPSASAQSMKRLKSWNEPDEILFFSDGLTNFGESEPEIGGIPVNTITSLLSADHAMLKYMASATGGKFINLMQETVDEAVSRMHTQELQFLYADYDKGEISDITPSIPQTVNLSSIFSLAGKLKTKSATITLHFGVGDEILYSKTIKMSKSDAADYNNIVERVWAEKRIAELYIRYDKNKREIETLGKQFNIVTRNTSLIVLDRVEDYVQYEITPPEELLAEYTKQINYIKKNKSNYVQEHIESVVQMFDARKAWWNKSFPKTCSKQSQNRKGSEPHFVPPVIYEDNMVMADMYIASSDEEDMVLREEISISRMAVSSSSISGVSIESLSENKEMERDIKLKPSTSLQQVKQAKIELKVWSPDTPYMKILKSKSDTELYRVYLDIKEDYKTTPSFYLDVATLFEERGLKQEALIILSNLAELEVENYRLLRVLANRLNQLGYTGYAIVFFDKVLELRPNEPQSYRDLGQAYAANVDYQKAVDIMCKLVQRSWDGRFPGIEVIVVEEINKVIIEAKNKKVKLDLSAIDSRLIYEMPVDIRIVLNWDTDNSDMDLWVTDPCGEQCFYNNPNTRVGGYISSDFTGGYGPEEFMIKEAISGKYKIQAHYFGSREQTLVGPTTVYLDIYTYYSTVREKKETITLRLTQDESTVDIGEIIFDGR
ncbi:VIT domain-containing protein [Dysgonomonas sp. ZJ279]|uniref:VIT domain-containing protein n=1 Tax=Dysgonomonas sp. ZJ279 TaxID=2709796 RepID=UPI0013EE00B0|nr:VIT domain-containing protein [Dysgonomonas sp. ZJ279]